MLLLDGVAHPESHVHGAVCAIQTHSAPFGSMASQSIFPGFELVYLSCIKWIFNVRLCGVYRMVR